MQAFWEPCLHFIDSDSMLQVFPESLHFIDSDSMLQVFTIYKMQAFWEQLATYYHYL